MSSVKGTVWLFTFLYILVSVGGAQVTVDAPMNNAVVNAPFYLQAEAPGCQAGTTASMAYAFDSGKDVVMSGAQSLKQTLGSALSGSHILHVKAWSKTGALCEQSLSLMIGGGVSVSAPAAGAFVSSTFALNAQAATCSGEKISSMGYGIDTGSPTVFSNLTSLNTVVSNAPTGAHVLHVVAWGVSGATCITDVPVSVSAVVGLAPGAGALAYTNIEQDGNYTGNYANCGGATGNDTNLWQTQPDCTTKGTNTGSTGSVNSPTYGADPASRTYAMTYTASGGGVRWFDAKGPSNAATHFQYDVNVLIANVVTGKDDLNLMNLEMDINHEVTASGGSLYILATQCNLSAGLWQVTVNGNWVNTNAPCSTSQVTSGVWHRFQVQTHHDANGGTGIYYDAVAIDGNVTPITSCKVPSTGASISCNSAAISAGWAGVIGPNFQMDGANKQGGSISAYVDRFTVYYW